MRACRLNSWRIWDCLLFVSPLHVSRLAPRNLWRQWKREVVALPRATPHPRRIPYRRLLHRPYGSIYLPASPTVQSGRGLLPASWQTHGCSCGGVRLPTNGNKSRQPTTSSNMSEGWGNVHAHCASVLYARKRATRSAHAAYKSITVLQCANNYTGRGTVPNASLQNHPFGNTLPLRYLTTGVSGNTRTPFASSKSPSSRTSHDVTS